MFRQTVAGEMDSKLTKRKVVIKDGLSNNKRKVRKPWWNEQLTRLWNSFCESETRWRAGTVGNRAQLKADMKAAQRDFDRMVHRAKRQYWHSQQEQIMNMFNNDTRSFWKHIGQLGVRNGRNRTIPMQVVNADGQVESDIDQVLSEWQSHFNGLLNTCNGDEQTTCPPFTPSVIGPDSADLNRPVQMNEVLRALNGARNGKACGYDELPVEVLRNAHTRTFLLKLFDSCFETGCVPSSWKYVQCINFSVLF